MKKSYQKAIHIIDTSIKRPVKKGRQEQTRGFTLRS